jgi:hypothetical protein
VDALTRPTHEHVAAVKRALAGFETHSSSDGAVIWVDVPVSSAEKIVGGKFRYFCHAASESSGKPLCVLRNPTADVPVSLRAACDIISPIDDPFPPVDPLPGPIIEPSKSEKSAAPIAFAKLPEQPQAGCCFSLGFGALMKPCCLQAKEVDDVSSCHVEDRMGGASSSNIGRCPTSADEAAKLMKKNSHGLVQNGLVAAASEKHTTLAEAQLGGCCYAFGYGSMMKPCCLTTKMFSDASSCKSDSRRLVGGSSGYTSGNCPTSADQAAELWEKERTELKRPAIVHETAEAGCCFSFGYGAMMKPCCLDTKIVSSASSCVSEHRVGGASGYTAGKCPVSADNAAELLKKSRPVDDVSSAFETAELLKQLKEPALQSLQVESGCCFSFGLGSMNKPCCLEKRPVDDVKTCKVGRRIGGVSSYSKGRCPSSAVEAAAILAGNDHVSSSGAGAENVEVAAGSSPEKKASDAAADSSGSHSGTSNSLLVIACVLTIAALLGALALASQRRPDRHRTPFLGQEGAE